MVAYTSQADPGAFSVVGQDALYTRGYVAHSMPGRFTVTGSPATLYDSQASDYYFYDDVCEWSDTAGVARPYVLKGAVQTGDMIGGSRFADVCREGDKCYVAVRDGLRFEWLAARFSAPNLIVPITVHRSSAAPRTNVIRNNTMVGAVVGTPGTLPTNWNETLAGLTRQVVEIGNIDGIDYIDLRFSGTTNATIMVVRGEPITSSAVAALPDQTWTLSSFAQRIAGATTNLTSVVNTVGARNAAGGAIGSGTNGDLVPKLDLPNLIDARVAATRTLTDPLTAYSSHNIVAFTFASGVAVDITLRIGSPQLELSPVVTPLIRTSGAVVTDIAVDWPVAGRRIVRLTNAPAKVIRKLRRQTGDDGAVKYNVVNGQTVTLPTGTSVVLLLPPGGGIAGMTVVLPPGADHLDTIEFITTQPITAFTVLGSGSDFAYGSGYTLAVGASYRYQGFNSVWYRRY